MKSNQLRTLCFLFLMTFCIIPFPAFTAIGEDNISTNERDTGLVIVCTLDKASLFPGETAKVKVVISPNSKASLSFKWSATAGKIEGQGPEAQWSFTGVEPGLYTATVRISNPNGQESEYSVQAAVIEPSGAKGRETGRHLLVDGKEEESGYGLYSYVLFGSEPKGSALERSRKTVEAYLSLIPRIVGMEKYIAKKSLNIAYLPVREEDPEASDDPKERLTTQWVLDKYDLARARAILSKLKGDYHEGPYLLAFLSPPLKSTTTPRPYLLMDLSKVPSNLIRAWMKEFLNQAAQERYWETRQLPRYMLNLRTCIEVVSIGLPEAKKAVQEWITLAP